MPVYQRSVPFTRLLLLMASHDAVRDEANPGLLTKGTIGVKPMLNRERWQETARTVEHIAPQDPKKGHLWEDALYETDGLLHRLGNLTLLPLELNASISNQEWHWKKRVFKLLTATTPEAVSELRREWRQAALSSQTTTTLSTRTKPKSSPSVRLASGRSRLSIGAQRGLLN